ncbi:ankyrin repeat domain-containing protein [Aminobacter sp. MDW-2]|uniref:ankyrin repeat domain-containing protein n=1 Tax=Aminobacter sp. MDW-2 TaxID=2666139 RepID=UPI0012AEE404|nr:ankyrin repeat domain-containing protein [Aminobacter sp. MDW-2]MRX37162.1 c-type cytochrome [Aminobacter sp. MDW-2]QNH33288.1 ankyrin repeat domain-containing protein [Aminobacter sp. MDW-2]
MIKQARLSVTGARSAIAARSLIGALSLLWLLALPAQANELGDLVRNGDAAAVTSALDKGAAIDEIDGVTALYIACETGNAALADLLIKRGADVNLPVSWQRTPLYAANKAGFADIVKLLLGHGADPNQLAKGQTPLHVAAETGCLACVTYLVEAGSDVNALTSNGSPPIHLAKLAGHDDVVAYLHGHGAAGPTVQPISPRLASADAQSGKDVFAKTCAACHLSAPGLKVPKRANLWGIVGRQKGSQGDVQYSSSLKQAGGVWSFEDLNSFIANPALTLPGTDMSFPGLADDNQRADLIAYLRTLSETPLPLPGK